VRELTSGRPHCAHVTSVTAEYQPPARRTRLRNWAIVGHGRPSRRANSRCVVSGGALRIATLSSAVRRTRRMIADYPRTAGRGLGGLSAHRRL
jgi:hypothetical protein